MTKISETISNTEIVKLLTGMLLKIKEKAQENYSEELHTGRRTLCGYEYDPLIYQKRKETKKIWIFAWKVEEIRELVEIETNIMKETGRINVTISDAFIFPIAKNEIEKFVESHQELDIKEIVFIKNFSTSS